MSLKLFRVPLARRLVLLLTGAAYAGSLLLSACGGDESSSVPKQSSSASSVHAMPLSGFKPRFKPAQISGAKTVNAIGVTATSTPGSSTVQLKLPADADPKSLAVTLNGADVSNRFSGASAARARHSTAPGRGDQAH